MANRLKLELQGLNEAIKNIDRLGVKVPRQIETELDRAAIAIETAAKRNIKRYPAIDTGLLHAQTLRQSYSRFQKGVESQPKYAYFVEFGTRGGGKMMKHEHIEGWLQRQGIDKKFSFVIRRKIARNGQRPRPFLFPAAQAERANFIRNITKILQGL